MRLLFISIISICLFTVGANAFWQSREQISINAAPPASSMVTPFFVDAVGTVPSNSATNYIGITGGSSWSATQTAREVPIKIAGSISKLFVRFPTAIAGGTTYDICLTLNSSATCSLLTCQITNAALTCSDLTNAIAVVSGDKLSWKVVPTSTPTTQTIMVDISAVITSTVAGESAVFMPAPSTTFNTGALSYCGFGSVTTCSTTEASGANIVPTAGVLDRLSYVASAAPGAAKSLVLTVWKNGAPTSITCTLTGAGSGINITFCDDDTHTVTVAAGDTISLEGAPTGTPTIGIARATMRWGPTVPGEAIAMNSAGALATGAVRYIPLSGSVNSATESDYPSIAPSVFTVKSLYVSVNAAPGGAASRTIVFRKGTGAGQANAGTPTDMGCILTSLLTACSDIVNSFTTSAGDYLNWRETPASTPAAITYFKFSTILYTP